MYYLYLVLLFQSIVKKYCVFDVMFVVGKYCPMSEKLLIRRPAAMTRWWLMCAMWQVRTEFLFRHSCYGDRS